MLWAVTAVAAGPADFEPGSSLVAERNVDLGGPAFDDGEEAALGVLFEMRCCTVSIKRGLIVVLFVQEEPSRVARRAVCQVHAAARLGTGVHGEFVEERTASSSCPGLTT